MRKSRFSDEQVMAILREQEAGRPTAEVCRKYGVRGTTSHDDSGSAENDHREKIA